MRGLAPGKEKTRFGRWLLSQNALFASKPPAELLPQERVAGFKLEWIWDDMFYMIEFRKQV